MAYNHRKLLTDPENPINSTQNFCAPYCDHAEDGVCPPVCLAVCYDSCLIIPPPPPYFPSDAIPPPPPNPHKLSSALTISLSILVTFFFFFCCYTIYKCYTGFYRSRQRPQQPPQPDQTHDDFLDQDHGPVVDHPIWYIRTVGLQPSVISAISICKYKRADGLVEGTECSVCLNEFQEDETLRLLPKCNHAFHLPCIDTWLRSHTNCPMCRAGIVTNAARSPSPEQRADNSGLVEETQVEISGNDGEFGREREDEDLEVRIGTEEEEEARVENPKEEGGNSDNLVVDEVQPMRRSVSLDSFSASMISAAIAQVHPVQSQGNSETQLVKLSTSSTGIVPNRVDVNQSLLGLSGSPSIGRSLQKGPVSMKRSISCSGKALLSRHGRSRSRNSVLPS